ncbi:MAG: helix-turn-helix transcriptional regulator [Bacteroidaceae bacterium]
MNNREEIGLKVAEIRKIRGLTVRGLAEKSGVNHANIYRIEHGKYNVSIDILSKVLTALDAKLNIQTL